LRVTKPWKRLANLRREVTPARVFYFEHGVARNIQTGLAQRYDLWQNLPVNAPDTAIRRSLAVH